MGNLRGIQRHGILAPARSYGTRSLTHSLANPKQEYHAIDGRNPRHLLRHLLRECTYLPDPVSRVHFKQHILRRFRAYTTTSTFASPILKGRTHAKLREGRRALLVLRKANRGFFPQVNQVLNHTYGRSGRRSRQLMEPLKRATIGSDTTSDIVSTVLFKHQTALPSLLANQIPHLTPPIEALYLEQQQRNRWLDKSHKLGRSRGPEIALLNAWRRPLPPCRVKNQVKRWYAEVLGKILPPLPLDEWATLQGLSNGSIPWEMTNGCERRAMVNTSVPVLAMKILESELDLEIQEKSPASRGRKQPHRITNRFMRRRWADVLANSPRLELNESLERWNVIWASRKQFPEEKQLMTSLRAALVEDMPA